MTVWLPLVFGERAGQQPASFFPIAKHHVAKG